MPALGAHIRAMLRAIAVGTAQRIPALPDVPTVCRWASRTLKPHSGTASMCRMGTPMDVIKRLQEESFKALEVQQRDRALPMTTRWGGRPHGRVRGFHCR